MTTGAGTEEAFTALLRDAGVRVAGEHLVRTYAEDVYGLCRALARDAATAEDLAHDVFARALTALPSYRGEASPRTWLLTIARNRCFDHLRARKRERAICFDEPEAIEAHAGDEPLTLDRMVSEQSLRTALEALDEGDRALVVMRHAHALELAELAQIFGVREGTLRMRLSRAVSRMREALGEGLALPRAPAALPMMPAPAGPASAPAPASAPRARIAPPLPMGAPPVAGSPAPFGTRTGGYAASTVLTKDTVSPALAKRLGALLDALRP